MSFAMLIASPLKGLFFAEADRSATLATAQPPRKQQVVTQRSPALASLANAVVIKDEDLFFLTGADGQVPVNNGHGFGLYLHDCRFLNGYEIKLDGRPIHALDGTAERGFIATLELVNSEITTSNGQVIGAEEIGIQWRRLLDGRKRALHDVLTFHNFGLQRVEVLLTLTFQAHFEDVFVVRGLTAKKNKGAAMI